MRPSGLSKRSQALLPLLPLPLPVVHSISLKSFDWGLFIYGCGDLKILCSGSDNIWRCGLVWGSVSCGDFETFLLAALGSCPGWNLRTNYSSLISLFFACNYDFGATKEHYYNSICSFVSVILELSSVCSTTQTTMYQYDPGVPLGKGIHCSWSCQAVAFKDFKMLKVRSEKTSTVENYA